MFICPYGFRSRMYHVYIPWHPCGAGCMQFMCPEAPVQQDLCFLRCADSPGEQDVYTFHVLMLLVSRMYAFVPVLTFLGRKLYEFYMS